MGKKEIVMFGKMLGDIIKLSIMAAALNAAINKARELEKNGEIDGEKLLKLLLGLGAASAVTGVLNSITQSGSIINAHSDSVRSDLKHIAASNGINPSSLGF